MLLRHFDSIEALANPVFADDDNRATCGYRLGHPGKWGGSSGSTSWLGADTAEQAAERVTKGWHEGAQRILSDMADMEVTLPVNVQRKLTRTDQGDELDIHMVNRGQLDRAWTARRRRHMRSPLSIRIIAQCNLLAEFRAWELFWRGAAVVKLSDILVEAGYNVDIMGCIASTEVGGVPGHLMATFPLKETHAPLDLAQLAGVVCNAGFHRLFGFQLYYAMATKHHGSPGNASSDKHGIVISEWLDQQEDHGPMHVIAPYGINSKESAQAWISTIVNQLNTTRSDL